MPIISAIGRRSKSARAVILTIYLILCAGAVSMIYPLMLMLSGSVKSDTDYVWIDALPRYLWDDGILWMKYVEAKYGTVSLAEEAMRAPLGSWRRITPPNQDANDVTLIQAFKDFRAQAQWPEYWSRLGDTDYRTVLGSNARRYRRAAQNLFPSITAYSDAIGVRFSTWAQVGPPQPVYESRRFTFHKIANYDLLKQVKEEAPKADRVVINLDGVFWQEALRPQWGTVQLYNEAHGTHHTNYDQVLLAATPPPQGIARDEWSAFVRNDLGLAFIRVDPSATSAYRKYLANCYDQDIRQLNRTWDKSYTSFDQIELPEATSVAVPIQVDYSAFIKDEHACPSEAISVYGPRQGFEAFLAEHRHVPLSSVTPTPLPIKLVDYSDFQQRKGERRWEFLTRNYIQVLDYLLLHGNGVRNTVIYCLLLIIATLTINPLAAYALSRYRPPSTYNVLLFCMCTMAFPAEVTMIPNFLLLKHFPLYSLAVSAVVGIPLAIALIKLIPRGPDWLKGALAGAGGIVAGFWLLPLLIGQRATSVSLLNTFWALVLPAAANGFNIFLLKGFFDSVPQELYESAELDGAGEFTKFWAITMSLSKPILAVLALGAFTAAYSEFMMALVIIPDPKMWTMMVWLFQLQSQVHPTVVYASLVVAAIPTFLVFLFCQNLIMRGIVVPVEK